MSKKKSLIKTLIFDAFLLCIGLGFVFSGVIVLWISSFKIPTLESFEERKINQSTKIYDRTGEILLYDVFQDVKRTIVPYDKISPHLKNATIAIEDRDFYEHNGIKPMSFMRAVLANLTTRSFGQGGSTITQQVVKLSLLTTEKAISRKLKEWVLAVKLDKEMTKDEILHFYLNEIPYGGTLYGAEEASLSFYGKPASDLTIAQAAYLAALPQAPTYYSPFGRHRDDLDNRKNLVLGNMLELGHITEEEYEQAKNEQVEFLQRSDTGIKAPHFVFYIRKYLEDKYGQGVIETGGLKVTTTLDYNMQSKAEVVVKEYALSNKEKFDAENAALVAIDPKTGQILAMVGSRDYFDTEIDGNFNIATAHRQPGSTFKPFVYAEAFNKGYTTETVLFDTETVFSTDCNVEPRIAEQKGSCYIPGNYDDKFRGPITMRNALAQSINVPAIKTLYLAGINNVLSLAGKMGIENLGDRNQYGLSLALGGGEVSLIDITNAYTVFAAEGIKHNHTPILEIRNQSDDLLEKFTLQEEKVLSEETARKISDILSDNTARTPAYGPNSLLYFPGHDIAVKTGTTNDYRDAWIIGYSPAITVGAWAGNNDNRSMDKKVAGQIIAPLWNAFMTQIINDIPNERFSDPLIEQSLDVKPVLRGVWKGGVSTIIDKFSGLLATDQTPLSARSEIITGGIHNILYWVDRSDPRGPAPTNPHNDSQFKHWEYSVKKWLTANNILQVDQEVPTETDPRNSDAIKDIRITTPDDVTVYNKDNRVTISFNIDSDNPITKTEFYVNNQYIGASQSFPFSFNFTPSTIESIQEENTLKIVVTDNILNRFEKEFKFMVQ